MDSARSSDQDSAIERAREASLTVYRLSPTPEPHRTDGEERVGGEHGQGEEGDDDDDDDDDYDDEGTSSSDESSGEKISNVCWHNIKIGNAFI